MVVYVAHGLRGARRLRRRRSCRAQGPSRFVFEHGRHFPIDSIDLLDQILPVRVQLGAATGLRRGGIDLRRWSLLRGAPGGSPELVSALAAFPAYSDRRPA
jgi:hypothetical protein